MKANKLAYNAEELSQVLGISRPVAYELCKRADFPAIRISERRIIIPVDALQTWLTTQATEKAAL